MRGKTDQRNSMQLQRRFVTRERGHASTTALLHSTGRDLGRKQALPFGPADLRGCFGHRDREGPGMGLQAKRENGGKQTPKRYRFWFCCPISHRRCQRVPRTDEPFRIVLEVEVWQMLVLRAQDIEYWVCAGVVVEHHDLQLHHKNGDFEQESFTESAREWRVRVSKTRGRELEKEKSISVQTSSHFQTPGHMQLPNRTTGTLSNRLFTDNTKRTASVMNDG